MQADSLGPIHELDPSEHPSLARALGNTPETVISVHKLTRRLCRAWVAGDPEKFSAAVVQGADLPEEPMVFGHDAGTAWELLKTVPGWVSPNISVELAPTIVKAISAEMGRSVRYCGDVYHVMTDPSPAIEMDEVRQLTLADLPLLEATPVGPWAGGYESPRDLLRQGVVACALVDGKIVSVAHTYARSERHADIGARTFEGWERRGYATAAAAVVARRVQAAGQTPVWSAGEDHLASLRVAQNLGFREVSRRTYVILEKPSKPFDELRYRQ